jgi:hypothetical protein
MGLVEDLDRYFLPDGRAIEILLVDLRPSRRRPEGVANAQRLMAAAAVGAHPKRAPINVRRLADGSFLIVDGNSTFAVAKAAGWRSLRCIVDAGI